MTEFDIIEALKEVYDPEIPLDLVNLGLIKNVKIENNKIFIIMTLTTPNCPLENFILKSVKDKLKSKFKEKEIYITFDFTIPWNSSFISEEGKEKLKQLGWKV
ncbi:hypothetical protein JCM14244_14110 [Venenivibrio stagnispumantis]|uniref:Metal-sulfur cluster biosynthetic enzyme n=1 Tax=Venenivibrio stagnispumantis TaxID=407998 RepID=A0AA45WL91_9AQUI|nr:metal-sulfur cluster assembly factor [Venenivibrio stagnispumantis]MCW4573851.1 metal-sulfur cluster assembly factor [Venenivibrio stagnispumantis]SMP10039.1 Metal-sulfur cluster biosynthetic enzyme [Venenivibrio stagnispumantis]